MNIIGIGFQIIGSLGMLMYGMKMMSEGIQKSAGATLHKALGFMTQNRVIAVITGMLVTMLIQSSSATTVMVVSFVNAGLLTLKQSIGVIFGANIGTTVTAWIVSLFGFKFKISLIAVPMFGIGFLLSTWKRIKHSEYGEALMGFGLLFMGLDLLSHAIPKITPDQIAFLSHLANAGFIGRLAGVLAGAVITVLIHSSSASSAIIITMAFQGILPYDLAAAMILGSNIGTTIDAVLASFGTKVNARRAALVHVLFNVTGTLLAILFMTPLLAIVNFFIPNGSDPADLTTRLALLHTIFNLLCTLIFLPFVNLLAEFTQKVIHPGKNEISQKYTLDFKMAANRENTQARILRLEKEIYDMTEFSFDMLKMLEHGFTENGRNENFKTEFFPLIKDREDFLDQMQEEISTYLLKFGQLSITRETQNRLNKIQHIVNELESLSDDIYSTSVLLKRSISKKMEFSKGDMERLIPYLDLVHSFLDFLTKHIDTEVTLEDLKKAELLENSIDSFRKNLKKIARKRIEAGANVKAELLYIDIVRHIEKMGDRAFSIAIELSTRSNED